MGCDIHCYIEHQTAPGEEWNRWCGFGGQINPGRDYRLFGHLAGVRDSVEPLVPPRGLPADLDYTTHEDAWYWINHDPAAQDGDGQVCWETAQRYMKYGRETKGSYVPGTITRHIDGVPQEPFVQFHEAAGRPTHVSHPDWHTHSWLSTGELEEVFRRCYPDDADIRWGAILAAMKHFESHGYPARLVFWFDN